MIDMQADVREQEKPSSKKVLTTDEMLQALKEESAEQLAAAIRYYISDENDKGMR